MTILLSVLVSGQKSTNLGKTQHGADSFPNSVWIYRSVKWVLIQWHKSVRENDVGLL